jgi:hypothetical protein
MYGRAIRVAVWVANALANAVANALVMKRAFISCELGIVSAARQSDEP